MTQHKTNRFKKAGFILAILLLPVFLLITFIFANHNFIRLPFYGPYFVETVELDGEMVNDTIWHTVPPFTFVNQDNEPLTEEWIKGKIAVVDFFFSTCPTICPLMTKQMRRLQIKLDDPAFDDVRILSVTVNPEYDTPQVLKEYALKNEADFSKWAFATGNRDDIYEAAYNGFLVSALEDDQAPGGFLHSELFILIDKKGRIRGFYTGTDSDDVDNLADDIKLLLKEEKIEHERAKRKQSKQS
ncbi:MAG: SCO family protein [Luteibaculaceae bacterium]